MREAEDPGSEPTSATVSVDEALRKIYVVGPVDEEMVRGVASALDRLTARNRRPVTFFMYSEGGDEECGWAVHDMIAGCGAEVWFEGHGMIYSMAAAIMQAARWRMLGPNCQVMVHDGTVDMDAEPRYADAEREMGIARKNNLKYYRVLASRARIPLDQVEDLCKREAEFSAAEAVEMGLADGIVGRPLPKERKGRRRNPVPDASKWFNG